MWGGCPKNSRYLPSWISEYIKAEDNKKKNNLKPKINFIKSRDKGMQTRLRLCPYCVRKFNLKQIQKNFDSMYFSFICFIFCTTDNRGRTRT